MPTHTLHQTPKEGEVQQQSKSWLHDRFEKLLTDAGVVLNGGGACDPQIGHERVFWRTTKRCTARAAAATAAKPDCVLARHGSPANSAVKIRFRESMTRNAPADELWPFLNDEPRKRKDVLQVLGRIRGLLEHHGKSTRSKVP